MSGHHRALWILQWLFGLYFIGVGASHFIVPEGLPQQMDWMYDLGDTPHVLAGSAEILGGLGLILPGLTRIRPEVISIAALGLLVVMVLAFVWHAGRAEIASMVQNAAIAVVMAYVAYGRWRLAPLEGRAGTPATS